MACATGCTSDDPEVQPAHDLDQDGWTVQDGDCDDADPEVHPGATEIWYDGVDQDCDARSDHDQDLDGHDSLDQGEGLDCWDDPNRTPEGFETLNGFNPALQAAQVHPGADDRWYDGVDADCAGDDDFDADQDGAGTDVFPADGLDAYGSDCDDGDVTVVPGAEELCDGQDNDCDGTLAPTEQDGDADGYAPCAQDAGGWDGSEGRGADDCDDTDASVHPGSEELCDGQDNDCDGVVSDDEQDHDGDGYVACGEGPDQWRGEPGLSSGDCDDYDDTVAPGYSEVCDGQDNDCDGLLPAEESDDDGDGYVECVEDEGGWDHSPTPDFGDCVDTDATIHPGAARFCGRYTLADADWRLIGERQGHQAGYAVSPAGDVDNDGVDDFLIGAPGYEGPGIGSGAAYLVYGPPGAHGSVDDIGIKLAGEQALDSAGIHTAAAGDVDNDGYDDILVGAYGDDGGGSQAGAAYVVRGPVSNSATLGRAATKLFGEATTDNAGWRVFGAGDIDGDGFGDVLVSAPQHDEDSGAVYLVLAPPEGEHSLADADAKLTGEQPGDEAGRSVAGGGDANGDGVPDLIVGAWKESTAGYKAGAAYVVYGPIGGTSSLTTADARMRGEAEGDVAGVSVSFAGDLDNDGIDDVLVGAHFNSDEERDAGAAYVLYGPVLGELSLSEADARLAGEAEDDHAGVSVSGAGDVNGDGYADILVGAYGFDGGGGAAYLVFGPVTGRISLSERNARYDGEESRDSAGYPVSSAGDIDDDGFPDFLVGAYGHDDPGDGAGAAYLILGGTGL